MHHGCPLSTFSPVYHNHYSIRCSKTHAAKLSLLNKLRQKSPLFSPERLATGWTVRGSNSNGGEIFRAFSDRPWGQPSLVYNGYRVIFGGKAAGVWC